jgi:hypothetical protein
MRSFERRWRRLTSAARRAPEPPFPAASDRLLLRTFRGSDAEDPVLWRTGWLAAACLLACTLSLPRMADAFAAPSQLVPPLPTLPRLPRAPRLPAPRLPDVRTLLTSITLEESTP